MKIIAKWKTFFAVCQNLFDSDWCSSKTWNFFLLINLWILIKNHTFFFITWCNSYCIVQNLSRIEWENEISLIVSKRKKQGGWLLSCPFSRSNNGDKSFDSLRSKDIDWYIRYWLILDIDSKVLIGTNWHWWARVGGTGAGEQQRLDSLHEKTTFIHSVKV